MSTRYVLYTARRSGSASVEVMLGALGLDHDLKDATPWSDPPGPCFEELKTVNPLGQLPTLVTPGGEILTESVAVLWTLLERHPSDWVPAPSTRDRATLPALDAVRSVDRLHRGGRGRLSGALDHVALAGRALGCGARGGGAHEARLGHRRAQLPAEARLHCWASGRCLRCLPREPVALVEDARLPEGFAPGLRGDDAAGRQAARGRPGLETALAMSLGRALVAGAVSSLLLTVSAPAAAQIMVTLYAGYVGSDGVENASTDAQAEIRSSAVYAVARRFRARWFARSATALQQQSTTLTPGGGAAPFDLTIRYLHLGGTVYFDGPVGRGAYVVGGLGATQFSPSTSGYGSEFKPSINLGLGYTGRWEKTLRCAPRRVATSPSSTARVASCAPAAAWSCCAVTSSCSTTP